MAELRQLVGRDTSYGVVVDGYLNNFYCNFAFNEGEKGRGSSARDMIVDDLWDQPNRMQVTGSDPHSELWLNQSPKEFYETVDRVAEETGVDVRLIQTWMEHRMGEGATEEETHAMDLNLLPAEIRLREMGYLTTDM
ncbi:MAG: hypothetical protein ABH851_02290 [Methanobacteriota archaeon]